MDSDSIENSCLGGMERSRGDGVGKVRGSEWWVCIFNIRSQGARDSRLCKSFKTEINSIVEYKQGCMWTMDHLNILITFHEEFYKKILKPISSSENFN